MRKTDWLPVLFVLLVAASLTSCDPCKKLSKSKSIAARDSAAFCYYERGEFAAAGLILKDLKSVYAGDTKIVKVSFYHAKAKYMIGEAIQAAYYFNEFIQYFPASKYTEEATFLIGESYYLMSPTYELDQRETKKAIEFFQLYLRRYPYGDYAENAEKKLKELRDKLAKKAFEQADLYYKTFKYRSAVIAFKNMLADYPDSEFREEARFKLLKCRYFYAKKSVEEKQLERYEDALVEYERFVARFEQSEYRDEADRLLTLVKREMREIKLRADADGGK